MHSILAANNNTWCIVRSDMSNGTTFLTPLFNKLSFHSAMRVVNHLNGGDRLTDDLIRVLEMCKVN